MKKYSIELVILTAFFAASVVTCNNHPNSTASAKKTCAFSDAELDSLIFRRERTHDSILFEQVRLCPDLPRIVQLKLSLLTSLKKFSEGLHYLETLGRENFEKGYDSLIYRAFFESELAVEKEAKTEMFKLVVSELEKYLLTTPLDTLALGHYCSYSLKLKSSEFVFNKIDSMAFANHNDPTYAFVISLYFPKRLRDYQKGILL